MAGTKLEKMRGKISRSEVTPRCDYNRTQIDQLMLLPYTHQVNVHRSCECNELVSLHNRHLIDRTQKLYDVNYIKKHTRHILLDLDERMGVVEPVGLWDVVKGYSGAKRRSYARAAEDIIANGFNAEKASRVRMFVKPDKYDAEKVYEKAPRAIQYRNPTFNLMLAKYLKPIEHKLYETTDDEGFRWCAKGLNTHERAALIVEAAACFNDPCFALMDHSKYDSCVTPDHLRLMAARYSKWSPCKFLRYLLSLQINNKGVTKHGIRYTIKGTKMSGDYNTALDNSFLNYLCLRSLFDKNKIKAKYIIDGDDSVVVFERADLDKLMQDLDHFKRFGFDTKVEIVHELNEVEFCRSKVLDTEPPMMAREPIRALSNMCVGLKTYQGKARAKYLAGNALGEMHRSNGCPILFNVAKAVFEQHGKDGVILDTEGQYKLDLYRVRELHEPSWETREAYQEAYGIGVMDQILIESELQNQWRAQGTLGVSDTPGTSWMHLPPDRLSVLLY